MDGLAAEPVGHFDPKRGQGISVIGFSNPQAKRLLNESMKGFLGGKFTLAPRYRGPEQRRSVDRIVSRLAPHQGERRTGVVLDRFKPLQTVGPCHDIDMAAHGRQRKRVRLIEIRFYSLLIDLIGAAVPRQRV